MSKQMRRKHLQKTMDELSLPSEVQTIVQVKKVLANYLLEVKQPDESVYLASIPMKFRKNMWVTRGGYALVEPIAEGNKVKAEIVKVLQSEDIKYYKAENVWPEAFQRERVKKEVVAVNNSNSDDDDDDFFVNTNRLQKISKADDESSASESSDSSEESESDFEDAEESQEKPNVQNDVK